MEQLIVCQADDGRYAVRPVSWAGIWDKSGLLASECKSIAYFDDEQDAKDYIAYRALGTVEELTALVKAQDEGRAILPRVSERDKKGMADFLHDCFADWTHDPSVGLYGMTEGEAILANAIMDALTRAEAEAALQKGGPHETDPV